MKKIILFLFISITSFAQQNRLSQYINNYFNTETPQTILFKEVTDKEIINKYGKEVSKCKIVTIDDDQLKLILNQKSQSLKLLIPFPDGSQHHLTLVSNGFNDGFFQINTSNNETVEKPNAIHYRGIIDNDGQSIASVSFFDDNMMGVVSNLTEGDINIGKIIGQKNLYIIYAAKDAFNKPTNKCDVTNEIELPANFTSQNKKIAPPTTASTKCIRLYLETDYELYLTKGATTTNVTIWTMGMFNVWATVYQNEGIKIEISELFIWTSVDGYTENSSTAALNEFTTLRGATFNGDYAHLLHSGADANIGGLAWLGPDCGDNNRTAYSHIDNFYDYLPNYSWTIAVLSHEFGHNLGSNHTHWCGWPGGPIDNCYAVDDGPCAAGPTPSIGTIMSYCHLGSGPGVSLVAGFGPLPGAVILNEYNTRPCLGSCICDNFAVTHTVTNETCAGVKDGAIQITVTGGVAPIIQKWNTNVTTPNITNIGAGDYTLIIGDANYCTKTIHATVVSTYTLPTVFVASNIICKGESKSINASGANTYSWSTGATSPFILVTPTVTTSYTVVGTDGNGCKNTSVSIITVNDLPTISVTSNSMCAGNFASISASGSAATYTWSNAQTSQTISVNPSATTQYTCIGSTAQGCKASAVSTVVVAPNPTVALTSGTLCVGKTLNLTATGAPNYLWSSGDVNSSIAVTPTITTTYTCVGTYATGCNNTAVTTVTVFGLPIVSVANASVCTGKSTNLIATGANTYNWSNGASNATITVMPTANTSYTCIGTSVKGCTNTATANVVVYPTPTLALTSGTICFGMTATVSAAPALTYTWSNGSNSSSFFVVPTATTIYTCTGASSQNCPFISTTTLVVISIATPNISQNGMTLTSSSATGNQWYFNSVAIPGATGQSYTATQNGSYSLIVSDNNGCASGTANKTILDTGLENFNLQDVFSLYPNPTQNYLYVSKSNEFNELVNYRIYSSNGQLVKQGLLKENIENIDVINFASGLYLIELSIETHKTSFRFIKE